MVFKDHVKHLFAGVCRICRYKKKC